MRPERVAELRMLLERDPADHPFENPPITKKELGEMLLALEDVEVLRTALEGVLAVCQDRQAFVMLGPRAFAKAERIATVALGSIRSFRDNETQ